MSCKTLTTYTCDRCKKTVQTDKYQMDGWSVWYFDHGDKAKEWHRDICEECTSVLEAA